MAASERKFLCLWQLFNSTQKGNFVSPLHLVIFSIRVGIWLKPGCRGRCFNSIILENPSVRLNKLCLNLIREVTNENTLPVTNEYVQF